MKKYICILLIAVTSCLAIEKEINPYSLKLDQETYLTDKNGIFIPNLLVKLMPGNAIKIYLTDGTELMGLVKTTEMFNGQIFKVFGEIVNKKNTGFGFVLTKDAVFAGAVVFRDTEDTYAISYDESRKGFILSRQVSKKLGS